MSRTANPKAVLQISHGMAEHSALYKPFCEYMAQRGFVVVINDHLGHGRSVTSGALYGHFGEKGGLYKSSRISAICEHHARKISRAAVFSHGPQHGLVHRARICGRLRQLPHGSGIHGYQRGHFDCHVEGRAHVSQYAEKRQGAQAKIPSLEKIATGPYNKKFKPNRTNYDWVTSKEEEVDRFVNDPLCGFPLTVQGYIDLGTLLYAINTDQWYRRVPKDLPILLISGENDPVGDMGKGVRRVFDKLNKTGHDVKLTLYPRIRHALITEMNSAQVYEDLYAFFSSHLPKAEEPVYEKETEAEPEVSTETEISVENPAAEEEKETEAAAAEKYDDMPEENAELPVI